MKLSVTVMGTCNQAAIVTGSKFGLDNLVPTSDRAKSSELAVILGAKMVYGGPSMILD